MGGEIGVRLAMEMDTKYLQVWPGFKRRWEGWLDWLLGLFCFGKEMVL